MAFIYYVTQIQFEYGAVQLLKQECERVGITRPLVVTDPGVKAAGVLQKALDALSGMTVAVFDQTPSNPTEAAVRAAVQVYQAQGCDGLIAVGGGSATAKRYSGADLTASPARVASPGRGRKRQGSPALRSPVRSKTQVRSSLQ